MWRSKSPVLINSAITSCSKVGTVQEKKPSFFSNSVEISSGKTIYATRREGDMVLENVFMYIIPFPSVRE